MISLISILLLLVLCSSRRKLAVKKHVSKSCMCACNLSKVLSCYGFCASVWVDHPLGWACWAVITLSSNFPMLSITLRNNLDILFHLLSRKGILGEDDMLAVGLSFLTLICMLSVLKVEFLVSPKATPNWMLLVLSFDMQSCHGHGLDWRGNFGGNFAARNGLHLETVARSPHQAAQADWHRRILLTLLAVVPPTFFSYIAEVCFLQACLLVKKKSRLCGRGVERNHPIFISGG